MAPEQVCDDFHEVSYRACRKVITEDQHSRNLIDTKSADEWRRPSTYDAAQYLDRVRQALMENGWGVGDLPRNSYAERLPLRRNGWH